jgi:xylulokinase
MDAELSRAGAKTGLRGKLGEMVPYDAALGTVAPYFADRYGLPRDCTVLAGTGDTPATLLGTGGRIVISLGSSFTVNGVLERVEPQRDAEYNIFGYTPGTAMGLSVITNGAKVHDSFLEHYVGEKDWERYLELADGPSVSAREDLLLPYEQAESVPRAPAGVVRDGFSDADAATNIRALHVSQAVSLKLHAAHLSAPDAVCIVGGASRNSLLRRMITDAFGARSYAIQHGEYAAPLGCAVAAARHVTGESYTEAADRFVRAVPGSELEPNHAMRRPYEELTTRYAELERTVAE